jgi:hypothetical protein
MAGARRDLTIPEDRLGNLGFAALQGDTPYLISPYAGEIAEIDDRERQGVRSDRSPITHRSLRCPPLDKRYPPSGR